MGAQRLIRIGLISLLGTLSWNVNAQEPMLLRAVDCNGRPFELQTLRGQIVALTFASRYTKDEAARVNGALNEHHARVVTVVDFQGIPGAFHSYAKKKMAENDRRGRIRQLVDERSEFRRTLSVQPDKRVDIFVIDREGSLRGRYIGEKQLEEALAMVDDLSAADESAARKESATLEASVQP